MVKIRKDWLNIDNIVLLNALLSFVLVYLGITSRIFYLVVLAYFALLTVFGKVKVSYYNLFLLLPYSMVFKLSPASTSLFTYYMMFAMLIIVMRVGKIGKRPLALIICFAVYSLFGAGTAFTTWLKQIAAFILLYFFVKMVDIEDTKNYIAAYGLGLVGSSIIGLDKTDNPAIRKYFTDLNSEYIGGVETFRFSGLYQDPNYFSVGVILVLFLGIILLIYKKAPKTVFIPMLIVLVYFGFMTYSKVYAVGLVLVIFSIGFFLLKTPKRIGMATAFAVILLGVGYFIVTKTTLFEGMIERFQEKDVTNGRFYLWGCYFEHIMSDMKIFLFGEGLGGTSLSVGGAHNTYIELLYFLGVIGSTVYILLLKTIMDSRKLLIKRQTINYMLFVIFAMMIVTLGYVKMNDFLFYFMFLWLSFNLKTQLKKHKQWVDMAF